MSSTRIPANLAVHPLFTGEKRDAIAMVARRYPVRVTDYYLGLIREADDPIYRQCIPSEEELTDTTGQPDPLQEDDHSPVPCLYHRYPDRVLLLVTSNCAMYCRFCTRKRNISDKTSVITDGELTRAVEYLQSHEEVHDVLISGGDPLTMPLEKLKEIMAARDPEDFQRWKDHRRKLIRALEVFEITGKSITALQKAWRENPSLRYDVISRNLVWDRELLKKRIESRTDKMLEAGWVEEARAMINQGLLNSPTAHQALGYKHIADYLNGRSDYDSMRKNIITATWQYARRQKTWFRRNSNIIWYKVSPKTTEKIIKYVSKKI